MWKSGKSPWDTKKNISQGAVEYERLFHREKCVPVFFPFSPEKVFHNSNSCGKPIYRQELIFAVISRTWFIRVTSPDFRVSLILL